MSKNITVAFDDSDYMSVYKNKIISFKLRSFSSIPSRQEGEIFFLRSGQNYGR